MQNAGPQTRINHLCFNQENSCLLAGVDTGFCVFEADPFRPLYRRNLFSSVPSPAGGISLIAMLHECNAFALVGTGSDQAFAPNKVVIWKEDQSRIIGELSFRSDVMAVKLRRDRLVVVLEPKIFVYNLGDLKLLHLIDTFPNPRGLCEISQTSSLRTLACLGVNKGELRIEYFDPKRHRFVTAHESNVVCIAMDSEGGVIATASSMGTLFRIFNALDGSLLREVVFQTLRFVQSWCCHPCYCIRCAEAWSGLWFTALHSLPKPSGLQSPVTRALCMSLALSLILSTVFLISTAFA